MPTIRKGSSNTQTMGYSTSASKATGQQKIKSTHHSRNVNMATPPSPFLHKDTQSQATKFHHQCGNEHASVARTLGLAFASYARALAQALAYTLHKALAIAPAPALALSFCTQLSHKALAGEGRGFVSGHAFRRAERAAKCGAFRRCKPGSADAIQAFGRRRASALRFRPSK